MVAHREARLSSTRPNRTTLSVRRAVAHRRERTPWSTLKWLGQGASGESPGSIKSEVAKLGFEPPLPLMGIVNADFANSFPRGGMGIVNERVRVRDTNGQTYLITPHGDRKPAFAGRLAYGWCVSLPLNGDRKHAGCVLLCSLAFLVLITPHGDRKLDIQDKITAKLANSLPLMGIVNDNPDAVLKALKELITPHGDRKRARRQPNQQIPHLITPHGDRKPVTLSGMGLGLCQISLPLMGIVNNNVFVHEKGCPNLITPHGDRKPVLRIAFRSASPTHYPSWGS